MGSGCVPSVLILGARSPAALDHARRFAHQGWTVVAADSIPCRIMAASKAVTTTLRIASPRHAPARFADDLAKACRAHAIDLLLPTCEEVFYVSRYRYRLPSQVRVLADGFDKLGAVHSKWRFLDLARDCGAHVPESALVASLDEARAWAGDRPVAMKPEFSRFGVHVRLYRDGIPRQAAPLAPLGAWVVQAFAAGREVCSYSVADEGRLVAHGVYRPGWRLSSSSSFYFEPVDDPVIRDFVRRFALKTGFTGQLSFDWIQGADGRATVLECNPRATSGCHLFSLDDPLPAALAGTSIDCVEPSPTPPRMIGAVMLTAGLIASIRERRVGHWLDDYRRALDVIGIRGDRGPVLGAIRDLPSYARLSLAHRGNLRVAATEDIEWDGQDLVDA